MVAVGLPPQTAATCTFVTEFSQRVQTWSNLKVYLVNFEKPGLKYF